MPHHDVGKLIMSKLTKPKKGWVLSMDRTNWKFGKTHINILTVGVVINKVAIPIVWKVLPQKTKRGNSNTSQRIEVMKDLLRLIDAKSIHVLLMDREFIGKQWLSWLDLNGFGYVVRLRRNTIIGGKKAHEYTSTPGRKPLKALEIWGLQLFMGSKKITNGRTSHLYVVSNKFTCKDALQWYQKRWAIELLFSHLKKRGFNLEDTHLTDGKRIEKLMAVISLSFLFTFGWGCHLRGIKKQTSKSKRKSLFRLGLENLLEILTGGRQCKADLTRFIRWLESDQLSEIFVV